MIIKKLYWFILKSYLGPLLMTFLITLFIFVMQFLWKYVDDLVGKGLDWMVIGELMMYASLMVVPMALPLAILLASLMTFGNLGENYELTAMKSAGISLPKIMSPLLILIIIISYFAYRFSNEVIPLSNLKLTTLMHDVKMTKPELDIKERVFYDGVPDFRIKIIEKDKTTNMLRGVMIYDHSDKLNKNSNVTLADSGKLQITDDKQYMKLTLYHGVRYDERAEVGYNQGNKRQGPKDNQQFRTDFFDTQVSYLHLNGLGFSRSDEGLFRNRYQAKNFAQLENDKDSIRLVQERLSLGLKDRVADSYFRQRNQNYNNQPNIKNTDISKLPDINIDSVYNGLTLEQKKNILEVTMTKARETKQAIEDQSRFILTEEAYCRRHEMEQHRKLTLPFACLVFFFIGAPLGAIIRKGGLGMPMVISVLFFVFYYIVNTFGEKLAREGVWIVYQGMWLSSFILFIIGVFLTYKSTNDSSLLNADAYYNFLEKILKKKKDDIPADN
jgi:lipopolysaccharide export system permease protein